MSLHCPGRDSNAKLESSLISCPGCGRAVEIFGDEQKVHCRCGQWLFRDALPSCAQWCPAAEQCLGDLSAFVKSPRGQEDGSTTEQHQERMRQLRARIAAALAACPLGEKPSAPKGRKPSAPKGRKPKQDA